jgi:hypothetical protein
MELELAILAGRVSRLFGLHLSAEGTAAQEQSSLAAGVGVSRLQLLHHRVDCCAPRCLSAPTGSRESHSSQHCTASCKGTTW